MVVGMDLLPVEPVAGVTLIQADFDSAEGRKMLTDALRGRQVDWVFSDMAPEMSGNRLVDQMRLIRLNEPTLHFARQHLSPGGNLLMKTFMGEGFDALRHDLGMAFQKVKNIKPVASRKTSPELYLLGQGLKNLRYQNGRVATAMP